MVAQNRPRRRPCPAPCRRASPRSARRGARAAPTPSRPASWRLPRSCPSPSPCGRTSSRPAGRGPSGLKGRGRAGMTEPRPPFALYSDSVRSRTMLAEHRRMNIKTVIVCSKMETKIFFDAFLGGLKARLQRPHRVQSAAIGGNRPDSYRNGRNNRAAPNSRLSRQRWPPMRDRQSSTRCASRSRRRCTLPSLSWRPSQARRSCGRRWRTPRFSSPRSLLAAT